MVYFNKSFINLNKWEDALAGLAFAKQYSRRVIVEKFITGLDFRVLVIDNKIVAAAQRVPAHVVGDGKLNIQQLIDSTLQIWWFIFEQLANVRRVLLEPLTNGISKV